MSKRVLLCLMWMTACGGDESADGRQGAIQCAELSVTQCGGQGNTCQILFDDADNEQCGEERIGVRSCDVMSVEECKKDARCETIDGRSFDEERMCVEAKEPAGCHERGRTCPPDVTYARAADLKPYQFTSGCWPSGWEPISPVSLPQDSWPSCELRAGECEALPPNECQQDLRCMPLSGRRIDETKRCLGDETVLSCVPRPTGCTAVIVTASSPAGQRWWFSSGCIPTGYTANNGDESVSWPLCTPLVVTPKSCTELSGDACEVDRSDCMAIKGTSYDAARTCVRGEKNVGCMPKAQGCATAISYGRDAQGQDWQFPSKCQPAGFTSLNPSAAEKPQASWTQCVN